MTGADGRRTLTAGWQKYPGNPVLGGALGSCFDMSVERADDRYRMWFSWRPHRGIGYAESDDGLEWHPKLHVVLGTDASRPDEDAEVSRPFVLREDDGYTMWYSAHSDTRVVICRATSRDGLNWQRRGTVLVPERRWEKAAVMCPSVIRDSGGGYHLWYSGGERYEPDAVGYATSPDGVDWCRVGDAPVLVADPASRWERHRVAGAHVFVHEGYFYAAYIGFSNGFEDSAIGIARSLDGVHWQRHAENPVLTRGGPGAFDAINVYKPFVLIEGAIWRMWFNASAALTPEDTSPGNRIEQIGHAQSRFSFIPMHSAA